MSLLDKVVLWFKTNEGWAARPLPQNQRPPIEREQVQKRQRRYEYGLGPMYYLGQQIVKLMEDAGYPCKIWQCYRSPEDQTEYYVRGTSKAKAWQSPHQYYEAVDLLHPSLYWDVSDEYWETLAACVRTVADKYGVPLVHGHTWGWDSAHVELPDWRVIMRRQAERFGTGAVDTMRPTEADLWARFQEVLPGVAKAYLRSDRGRRQRAPGESYGFDPSNF
jgi:hypothetical protein